VGWSIGYDTNWKRDVGYGVPAQCDHPDCAEEIHRGLAYVCGDDVYGGEHGCGLFFCYAHLAYTATADGSDVMPQRCDRCVDGADPFPAKPDVAEWLNHKLSDETWAKWRDEHADEVQAMSRQLAKQPIGAES